MASGCFLSTGRSLDDALARVRLAEELDYESVYVSHINGRESLTVLTAYALATQHIRVGTAVVPIYTRTPATMAQTAATIDELSGGRLDLGLGVLPPADRRALVWPDDRPAGPRCARTWPSCARSWPASRRPPARSGRPASCWASRRGSPCASACPPCRPNTLRLAGEVTDGVLLWLCNPHYIADVVVPCVRESRERAGKTLEEFDVMAAVPGALTDDPLDAWNAMRRELLPYFALPFYRAMLERSGFDVDIESYDAAGGEAAAMQAAVSDEFLAALTAVGDEDDVGDGLARYRDVGTTTIALGPMPGTDLEATLRAGAPGAG